MEDAHHTITLETSVGPVEVKLSLEDRITDDLCRVCNGTRKSVRTSVLQPVYHRVVYRNTPQSWRLFERHYAEIAMDIRTRIEQHGLNAPVCDQCQADFFIPGTTTHHE